MKTTACWVPFQGCLKGCRSVYSFLYNNWKHLTCAVRASYSPPRLGGRASFWGVQCILCTWSFPPTAIDSPHHTCCMGPSQLSAAAVASTIVGVSPPHPSPPPLLPFFQSPQDRHLPYSCVLLPLLLPFSPLHALPLSASPDLPPALRNPFAPALPLLSVPPATAQIQVATGA